jgi:hypothetical protein
MEKEQPQMPGTQLAQPTIPAMRKSRKRSLAVFIDKS